MPAARSRTGRSALEADRPDERGYAAIPVIRGAVAEVEEAWSRALGAEKFGLIRDLLVELNERLERQDLRVCDPTASR